MSEGGGLIVSDWVTCPFLPELMNIFRNDDAGRPAGEWIQTDNRSVLRQLGAEGR